MAHSIQVLCKPSGDEGAKAHGSVVLHPFNRSTWVSQMMRAFVGDLVITRYQGGMLVITRYQAGTQRISVNIIFSCLSPPMPLNKDFQSGGSGGAKIENNSKRKIRAPFFLKGSIAWQ